MHKHACNGGERICRNSSSNVTSSARENCRRTSCKRISQKSCGVLKEMGPQIQWLQSFVTDDKIYCVYIAPDEAAVRAHAQKGGFPANKIARVRNVIDPTTAEAA